MFYNFEHFSLSVLKESVGYQDWNSQNACQNSKQGIPWSDCFFRSSLIRVSPVCLGHFSVQNFRTFTVFEPCFEKGILFSKPRRFLLICVDALCPSQQIFSHVRIFPAGFPQTMEHLIPWLFTDFSLTNPKIPWPKTSLFSKNDQSAKIMITVINIGSNP